MGIRSICSSDAWNVMQIILNSIFEDSNRTKKIFHTFLVTLLCCVTFRSAAPLHDCYGVELRSGQTTAQLRITTSGSRAAIISFRS